MKFKKITTLQGYVITLITVVILSVLTGSHFFYYIIVLMLVNLLMMLFMVRQNAKKMQQYLHISDDEVSVGDKIKVEFKTNNTGIFPIAHARINGILFNKYNQMSFPSDNIFFNPYQIINIRENFEVKTRGIFTDGEIRMEYYDPLKIFKMENKYSKKIDLVVYPRIYKLEYFNIPSTGFVGTKKVTKAGYEDYSSLKKVRKYANGDSYKRIHWKLSSKRGEMFTKEYDSTSSTKMSVFLDAFKSNYIDDINRVSEDKVVEISASIIKYALGKNADTSLIYHSDRMVQLDSRDLATFPNVLKELVAFVSEGTMAFNELVTQETKRLEQGSFIVLVTTNISEELIGTIFGLKRRSFIISIILVNDSNLFEEKEIMLRSIGVVIYNIKTSDDIKSKLEVLYD